VRIGFDDDSFPGLPAISASGHNTFRMYVALSSVVTNADRSEDLPPGPYNFRRLNLFWRDIVFSG
jgi:hypothetical protein